MVQTIPELVTFDEFVAWYPENATHRYELHNGVIVEMPNPTGDRSEITGFIGLKLAVEIDRRELPYSIPGDYLLKPVRNESGYKPDLIVLDRPALETEPRWKKESVVTMGNSVRLAVEIVSTNWRDDYYVKLANYEEMGIPEYWIVDYLGLGGRKFIGNPKRPTLSVYELVDGEYQVQQFRGNDRIKSPTFPELNLTAQQVFQAGNITG